MYLLIISDPRYEKRAREALHAPSRAYRCFSNLSGSDRNDAREKQESVTLMLMNRIKDHVNNGASAATQPRCFLR